MTDEAPIVQIAATPHLAMSTSPVLPRRQLERVRSISDSNIKAEDEGRVRGGRSILRADVGIADAWKEA